jgi:hypothetical protein
LSRRKHRCSQAAEAHRPAVPSGAKASLWCRTSSDRLRRSAGCQHVGRKWARARDAVLAAAALVLETSGQQGGRQHRRELHPLRSSMTDRERSPPARWGSYSSATARSAPRASGDDVQGASTVRWGEPCHRSRRGVHLPGPRPSALRYRAVGDRQAIMPWRRAAATACPRAAMSMLCQWSGHLGRHSG